MSKKEPLFDNLPPGFSRDDFTPIKIKSVKKVKKDYLIEIAPDVVKEEGKKYHYDFKDGNFRILCNKKQLKTPGKHLVNTISEPLAIRAVNHLNQYGEDYMSNYSIVSFLYSNLEFFEINSKEELVKAILNDFNTDWTLDCPQWDEIDQIKWIETFGDPEVRNTDFNIWLEGLTKFQVGAVVIMGATFESVNTGFLLSKLRKEENLANLAAYHSKSYRQAQKKKGMDMCPFWPPKETLLIFENYLFWQGLGL
jgi:hypothetical protein